MWGIASAIKVQFKHDFMFEPIQSKSQVKWNIYEASNYPSVKTQKNPCVLNQN